jgi:hypothetical protein
VFSFSEEMALVIRRLDILTIRRSENGGKLENSKKVKFYKLKPKIMVLVLRIQWQVKPLLQKCTAMQKANAQTASINMSLSYNYDIIYDISLK